MEHQQEFTLRCRRPRVPRVKDADEALPSAAQALSGPADHAALDARPHEGGLAHSEVALPIILRRAEFCKTTLLKGGGELALSGERESGGENHAAEGPPFSRAL